MDSKNPTFSISRVYFGTDEITKAMTSAVVLFACCLIVVSVALTEARAMDRDRSERYDGRRPAYRKDQERTE